MTTLKSILRLGTLGLLAFAIAGAPELSRAADTDTNTVKKVKAKKKKTADTNSPVIFTPTPRNEAGGTSEEHRRCDHHRRDHDAGWPQ